jgi:hypothetical protein
MSRRLRIRRLAAPLLLAFGSLVGGLHAAADERIVDANEPIVISDDVRKTTTEVQSSADGSG